MDKDRLEAIKRLSKRQADLERQLVEAKSVADSFQRQVNKLDQDIAALFDGGPLDTLREPLTELDDYVDYRSPYAWEQEAEH